MNFSIINYYLLQFLLKHKKKVLPVNIALANEVSTNMYCKHWKCYILCITCYSRRSTSNSKRVVEHNKSTDWIAWMSPRLSRYERILDQANLFSIWYHVSFNHLLFSGLFGWISILFSCQCHQKSFCILHHRDHHKDILICKFSFLTLPQYSW